MAAAATTGATVEELNVDDDDQLLASYGLRIPVMLAPDGSVLAEGVINDRKALVVAIRRFVT
jgi:hypothetical protein